MNPRESTHRHTQRIQDAQDTPLVDPTNSQEASHDDTTTILDQPRQIEMFRLLQVKYALRLEVRTGLGHSQGSVKNLARDIMRNHGFISDFKDYHTKERTLEDFEKFCDQRKRDLFPELVPGAVKARPVPEEER